MTTYSHSRISSYENCPYQYKLHYIDKIEVEIRTTIEAFMGDMVHQTLEFLYKNKKFKKRVAKNILIKFYRDLWNKNYSNDILIVKADKENVGADNYRKMGEQFISNYYDRMKPFEQITILGLETQGRARGMWLEIDRKEPKGKYSKKNCVLSCYYCNNDKSDVFNETEYKNFIKDRCGYLRKLIKGQSKRKDAEEE